MRSFALFVLIGDAAAGDQVLSEVFGSPQDGSFRKELSSNGEWPPTHLGAYAASLDEAQSLILESQDTVQVFEGSWQGALTLAGLATIE